MKLPENLVLLSPWRYCWQLNGAIESTMERVCQLAAVPDNGAHELSVRYGDRELGVILLRHAGKVLAYANLCPHLGLSLNWLPNHFFDSTGEFLQCANHFALFRLVDGLCILGPCKGQRLIPLTVRISDDQWIELGL